VPNALNLLFFTFFWFLHKVVVISKKTYNHNSNHWIVCLWAMIPWKYIVYGVGGKNHGIRKIGKMNPYFLEYSENLGRGWFSHLIRSQITQASLLVDWRPVGFFHWLVGCGPPLGKFSGGNFPVCVSRNLLNKPSPKWNTLSSVTFTTTFPGFCWAIRGVGYPMEIRGENFWQKFAGKFFKASQKR